MVFFLPLSSYDMIRSVTYSIRICVCMAVFGCVHDMRNSNKAINEPGFLPHIFFLQLSFPSPSFLSLSFDFFPFIRFTLSAACSSIYTLRERAAKLSAITLLNIIIQISVSDTMELKICWIFYPISKNEDDDLFCVDGTGKRGGYCTIVFGYGILFHSLLTLNTPPIPFGCD